MKKEEKGIAWSAPEIIKVSFSWARQYDSSHCGYQCIIHSPGSRATLEGTWVHLFTDRLVANDNGNASNGGVLRDHHENWILEFNRYLGRCTVFEAELWDILNGLPVLLSKWFKRETIQSDNLEVIRVLHDDMIIDT
ncbi:hypothetical protein PVK06_023624 [Gossypium arboreum]|uniref:RNase H type-1 domain-containing protein n=1 Tax=Gossypium arboreum TaxID=29729 RepID=A0ABR0PBX9_GOSAR|nr:hypothetical protein PVK06_023624 [Gossypium arboreum]